MFSSPLSKELNITYPIIQAPMAGGITTPELVAAVSNAGGLGSIASGYMSPESLRESIRQTKQLTDKPFQVNLFVPGEDEVELSREELEEADKLLHPFYNELEIDIQELPTNFTEPYDELVDVVIDESIPVVSFTFGIPSEEVIQRLKQAGAFVIGTATTVNEAIHLEKAGMDAVVAQGSEAGGHRGTFSTDFEQAMVGSIALIPQVVDNISIPVIAAGGIMDARGVLAAEVLGASAVQMGTAFLTCEESGTNPIHQKTILESFEDSTVVTNVFSGKPARGIHNYFIEQMNDYEHLIPPYPAQNALTSTLRKEAGKQQNIRFMSLWSGQGARLSKKTTAANLIKEVVQAYEQLIAKKF
ncbi:nitronate monooxygenase [Pueribacillus theae]|uniref:Probable nitronate monooxygenase n=1 Tax=Pueribacillus theae TaxID=2171751 RepID=A0A2U1K7H2_9BACI|nr:nitronate monooxygenase [Pueribacillus theae]PWA13099.1 nitronate monooxygenase [Pueribacillus theae]